MMTADDYDAAVRADYDALGFDERDAADAADEAHAYTLLGYADRPGVRRGGLR